MDNKAFETALKETIAWCTSRFSLDNAKNSLRSDKLSPHLIHDRESPTEEERDPHRDEVWFKFLMGAGEVSWGDVLEGISCRRLNILKEESPKALDDSIDLASGNV